MVNKEDVLLKIREIMLPEIIKESKGTSDVAKRAISKEIVW